MRHLLYKQIAILPLEITGTINTGELIQHNTPDEVNLLPSFHRYSYPEARFLISTVNGYLKQLYELWKF